MKKIFATLGIFLGLILSAASIGFIAYPLLRGKVVVWFIILCSIAFIIGMILIGWCRNVLRKERNRIRSESILNGTGTTYANATKKERDRMDKELAIKSDRVLSLSEFKSVIKEGSKTPESDLTAMVGLKKVKDMVLRFKAQAELMKRDGKTYSLHCVFLGNPGTGKTTISSILTGILYELGFIKKNEYVSIDGNFLNSSENPVLRTKLLLARSKGKVVFIDEAYSIINNPIGHEVLATLLNEIENNRDSLIVILAGYKKEMKALLNANSGLSSRFKNYFFFEDYDENELIEMFGNLINREGLIFDFTAMERLKDVLSVKRKSKSFANGRTVRNLAEKAIIEHAYRVDNGLCPDTDRFKLVGEDIVSENEIDDYLG